MIKLIVVKNYVHLKKSEKKIQIFFGYFFGLFSGFFFLDIFFGYFFPFLLHKKIWIFFFGYFCPEKKSKNKIQKKIQIFLCNKNGKKYPKKYLKKNPEKIQKNIKKKIWIFFRIFLYGRSS